MPSHDVTNQSVQPIFHDSYHASTACSVSCSGLSRLLLGVHPLMCKCHLSCFLDHCTPPPPSPYKMMSIMAYTVDLNVQLLKTIDRHRFHTTCAYLFLYLDLDFTHPYLKILDSALCITCDKEYLLPTWITITLLRVLLFVGTI